MGKRYDLVVFDMDGVLTTCRSSWEHVHKEMGVDNSESLKLFIEGKIDEKEFVRRDIALWLNKNPDVREKDILHILRSVPLIDGIQETVACLKYNNIKSVICSGGLKMASAMLATDFGFDDYTGVEIIKNSDGSFTGEGKMDVSLSDKSIGTKNLIKKFGTTKERTVSIGNSCTDIKMFESTALSIAFNPIDKETENAADVVIRSKNISDILGIILGLEDGC